MAILFSTPSLGTSSLHALNGMTMYTQDLYHVDWIFLLSNEAITFKSHFTCIYVSSSVMVVMPGGGVLSLIFITLSSISYSFYLCQLFLLIFTWVGCSSSFAHFILHYVPFILSFLQYLCQLFYLFSFHLCYYKIVMGLWALTKQFCWGICYRVLFI